MTLMAVMFYDHSPGRFHVGEVRLVAHECRTADPGYPKKYLCHFWVQPVQDIGPLSASFFYYFPYSSDSDQLVDAPLPAPFLYPSPYTKDLAGNFHPSASEVGSVEIDEIRGATLYRSLAEATAHRSRLMRF